MNQLQLPILTLLLLFICWNLGYGQDVNPQHQEKKHLITLEQDKVEYVGVITKSTKDSVWINIEGEGKQFAQVDISSIELFDYNGRFNGVDRNYVRHILAPTAFNLKKGDVYYQNLLLIGNLFGVGVSDDFSITGGAVLPPITYDELFFYVAPKFSQQVNSNFSIGGGLIFAVDIDVFDFEIYELLLVPFLNGTIGSRDLNFTFGFGFGVEDDDLDNNVAAMMFGSTVRLSNYIVLVSENTFAQRYGISTRNYYLGAHAIRFVKRKNTLDLGLLTFRFWDDFFPVPYLGYVRFF